jgi:deazaflavin-dependent oxidoreductase (nitroreductase family)
VPSTIAKLDPTRRPIRWLLRFPVLLYRAHLGWILGERFVHLTVRGRITGLPRDVVLEVLGPDPATGGLFIASAWGRRAQWFRNLEANPRAQVELGRRRFLGEVSVLDERAASEALRHYALVHRFAYRWFIGPLLLGRRPTSAAGEFTELAGLVPILLVRAAA